MIEILVSATIALVIFTIGFKRGVQVGRTQILNQIATEDISDPENL